MNKVAICIAGEMRYWEITKDIFNSFDADIFISTWDTNNRQDNYPYKFHGNNNMNMDIINSLDNLKEAELEGQYSPDLSFQQLKQHMLGNLHIKCHTSK